MEGDYRTESGPDECLTIAFAGWLATITARSETQQVPAQNDGGESANADNT